MHLPLIEALVVKDWPGDDIWGQSDNKSMSIPASSLHGVYLETSRWDISLRAVNSKHGPQMIPNKIKVCRLPHGNVLVALNDLWNNVSQC